MSAAGLTRGRGAAACGLVAACARADAGGAGGPRAAPPSYFIWASVYFCVYQPPSSGGNVRLCQLTSCLIAG